MKYALIAASALVIAATPALAGGRGGIGVGVGSLVGGITAPVGAAVSHVNLNALNNVSVLSNNKVPVNVRAPVTAPITAILRKNSLLGGGLFGCGCN